MSKSLYISDVHTRWRVMKEIIDRRSKEVDTIIFGGDAWDNFGDTIKENAKTAEYLCDCLARPNFIWIGANHDLPYIYPNNPYLRCSGNTADKCKVIREVMGKDIYKFQLHYWDEYFCYSHAGLSSIFLPPPSTGLLKNWSPEWMEERCNRSRINAEAGIYDPILGAGFARGGRETTGGITWLDFEDEFAPIEGLSQIFGHSRGRSPRRILAQESYNLCLDTDNRHYAIADNNKVTIYETATHKEWNDFSLNRGLHSRSILDSFSLDIFSN